jgi:hypothetical protein
VHILDFIVVIGIVLFAVATVLSALGFNVDKSVERSVARLCTPQTKLAGPDTPAKETDVVNGAGPG